MSARGVHPAAQLIADNFPRLTHRNGTRFALAGFGADSMASVRVGIAEAIVQLLDDNGMPVPLPGQGKPVTRVVDTDAVAEPNDFVKQAMVEAHLRFLEKQKRDL